jgi:hypothetical protein
VRAAHLLHARRSLSARAKESSEPQLFIFILINESCAPNGRTALGPVPPPHPREPAHCRAAGRPRPI